jgi:predicted lipid-binding transport protein (Tim44 family)
MAISASQQPAPDGARRTVAGYDSYQQAERAVDWLADQGFPVEHVSIVGTGLRYVEQVAGRVTTGRAAMAGAGQGAMLGLLFGLLFGLFFTVDGGSFLGVILYGLIVGAIFGAVLGAFMHAARGGRRDFASVSGTQAERYELQVDDSRAEEARRVLADMPAPEGSAPTMP